MQLRKGGFNDQKINEKSLSSARQKDKPKRNPETRPGPGTRHTN